MIDTMPVNKTIFLVDDDVVVCNALAVMLEASGYQVRTCHSAEEFLQKSEPDLEGVLLLDQRMTGMSGLDLQAELARRGIHLPIIFMTAHGDVPMSVKAVKAGAIDFLEKPLSRKTMLASIREAFAYADAARMHHSEIAALKTRFATLNTRERVVTQGIVAGMTNRQLAQRMKLSQRTIENHRASSMKKMGADSLQELVRKYDLCAETAR